LRTDLIGLDAVFRPSVPLYSGTLSATIVPINLIYGNFVLLSYSTPTNAIISIFLVSFSFRRILRDNALKSIQVLIEQTMPTEKYGKFPKKLTAGADAILQSDELTLELVPHIQKIWASKCVTSAWEGRANFQIHGAADYYLKNVERFAQENFEPTTDDILRARMRTSGIIETKFEEDGSEFSIVDVGGQRTERRKWLHCFEGVSAVIYLAALDEYDMKLEEDQNTNRMMESIKLFGEVTSSQWLRNTSVILFLNKDDLFREKILKSPLEKLFPDYTHGPDYKKALEFITEKYRAAFGSSEFLYTRITCAIDTDNIMHIFDSIRDNAFRKSLQNFM